jgi:hypothetical protein
MPSSTSWVPKLFRTFRISMSCPLALMSGIRSV